MSDSEQKEEQSGVEHGSAFDEVLALIQEEMSEHVSSHEISFGELTLHSDIEHIIGLLRFLKEDNRMQFICIIDVCGVDYPTDEQRFEVVYHLLSPKKNLRLRIKLRTDEVTPVPSSTGVFPGSDWFEREAYDMYGILFNDHPDLRRLLTDYGFDGHPMRKDFPLTGYVEVRYDEEAKRVVYEPVELRQEFRSFDYESPWEGVEYELPGDEKASQ